VFVITAIITAVPTPFREWEQVMKLLIRGGSIAAGFGEKKCYADILEESLLKYARFRVIHTIHSGLS